MMMIEVEYHKFRIEVDILSHNVHHLLRTSHIDCNKDLVHRQHSRIGGHNLMLKSLMELLTLLLLS